MEKTKLTTKLFSLSCENQPGVLSRIITAFARPGYQIATLSQSLTDVDGIVLITVEVAIPGIRMDNMAERLGKIVGVLDVTLSFGAVPQTAVYRLELSQCGPALWQILQQHHTQTITLQNGHLLIQQVAHPADIQRLFNALDGPALLGFSRLPVPVSQPLCWEEVQRSLTEVGQSTTFSPAPPEY